MAMKKIFAIILNMLILYSLIIGQPSCFCVENAECKSTSNLQNEIKASSSFVAHSIPQVSVKDCCSDCYEPSDSDNLIGLQADLNPLEEAIVFWDETYLKKLITNLEILAIERAPPTLTSTNFNEFFIKTERILI